MLPASQLSPLTSLLPNPDIVEDVISSACTFALWHTMSGNQSASQLTCDKLQLYFLQRNQKGPTGGAATQQPPHPNPKPLVKKDIMSSIRSHRRESTRVDAEAVKVTAEVNDDAGTDLPVPSTPQRDSDKSPLQQDTSALTPASAVTTAVGAPPGDIDVILNASINARSDMLSSDPAETATSIRRSLSPTDGEQACAMESLLESIERDSSSAMDVSAILFDSDVLATQGEAQGDTFALPPCEETSQLARVASPSQELKGAEIQISLHSRSIIETNTSANGFAMHSTPLQTSRLSCSHSAEPQKSPAAHNMQSMYQCGIQSRSTERKRARDDEFSASGVDFSTDEPLNSATISPSPAELFAAVSPRQPELAPRLLEPSPQHSQNVSIISAVSSASLSASLFARNAVQPSQFITQQVALPRRGISTLVPNYLRPTRSQAGSSLTQSANHSTTAPFVEFAQPPGTTLPTTATTAAMSSSSKPAIAPSKQPTGKGTPPPQVGSWAANSKKKYQAPSSHLR